jgi:TRAP-type mannitol/chloroaromatic compound transport system substrate-binding protein
MAKCKQTFRNLITKLNYNLNTHIMNTQPQFRNGVSVRADMAFTLVRSPMTKPKLAKQSVKSWSTSIETVAKDPEKAADAIPEASGSHITLRPSVASQSIKECSEVEDAKYAKTERHDVITSSET